MSFFTAIKVVDGVTPTIFATIKPASTAAIATDPALVVAVSPNNSVAVTGTFFQATQPVSGTITVNQGTSPWVVSLTSTTITSGTITANIGTTGGLALDATLTGGTAKVRCTGNIGGIFDAPTGSAAPANAIQLGLRTALAYPTAVTDGQLVGAMADKAGRQVTVLNSPRDLVGTAALSSASASAVSFIPAGAAGVFNDIISLVITNETATATIVTLSDNGAAGNTYKFAIAANGMFVAPLPTPIPQGTAAAAWDVLNSAAVALDYVAVFAKNK